MPPKKKSPKKPPCSPNDVQYRRNNKQFCRSKPTKAKTAPALLAKSSPKKVKSPAKKTKSSPKLKAKSAEAKMPVQQPKQKEETNAIKKEETKTTKSQEFPVEATNREFCMRKYTAQKGVKLGQGQYGAIVPACADKECRYVLKISSDVPEALKDVYFLRLLKDDRLKDGSPIVPTLYDNWLCRFPNEEGEMTEHSFIVLDRWESDMQKLALTRGKEMFRRVAVYSKEELLMMFCLAYYLGKAGIVHGDLKPDQYLQKGNGKNIVVTDFGFSGKSGSPYVAEMGWSGKNATDPVGQLWSCANFFTKLDYDPKSQPDFPIWMNLMQLELYLVGHAKVEVIDNGHLYKFGGIQNFDRTKYPYCTDWAMTRDTYLPVDGLYFTMSDIERRA